MSLPSRQGRISVKPFASVPSLANLPPIQRPQASVSNVSSRRGVEDGVDLSEGCFATKTLKYTHQLSHWVNAVRNEGPEPIASFNLIGGSINRVISLSVSLEHL
jgi:hypothetical protein